MKKQERREEKGITLVALVVTIIVLIILAGVTLYIVLDQNGIINNEQQAVEDYENSQREEQELLNQVMNNPGGGSGGEITYVGDVPIPSGYVASQVPGENTVLRGLVIYEGTDPVTEANHAEALTTRNQYVWIPVDDINSMVMCESNSGTSQCNLVYDEEEDTLTCTTHPDTATELVGRLYTTTYTSTTEGDNTIYTYEMDFTKRDQTYTEGSGHHEPNTVSYDADNSLTIEQLKSDFTAMAKSVAKNGGFYISRYEVGEGGNSKKGQAVLTAGSSDGSNYLGANMWYGLYNSIRKIDENKQMIWGCQYDQVIKFIGEQAQVGHSDRNLTTTHALSGQNEQDCMKNIYDLEGNHYEWTDEANWTNDRAFRGTNYNDAGNGNFSPASDRYDGNPTGSSSVGSSRTTLYL